MLLWLIKKGPRPPKLYMKISFFLRFPMLANGRQTLLLCIAGPVGEVSLKWVGEEITPEVACCYGLHPGHLPESAADSV